MQLVSNPVRKENNSVFRLKKKEGPYQLVDLSQYKDYENEEPPIPIQTESPMKRYKANEARIRSMMHSQTKLSA